MQLRPYQQEGHDVLINALTWNRVALNASSTGVGKTVVTAAMCASMGLRHAVICPKSVRKHWERVCEEFGLEPLFITNYEQVKLGRTGYGKWKIRNKQFEWDLPEEALLVFDEVHCCKNRKTQNSKLLVAAKKYHVRTLALSATPAETPMDMYALGYLLDLHHGDSDFVHWLRANGVKKGRWGPIYTGGVEGMVQLNKEIFPNRGYRAVASELPGFPANQVSTLSVDSMDSAKVQKELNALALKADSDVALPVVELLRMRQAVELLKVKALCELAENDITCGNSVVIFVNFIDTLKAFQDHFGEDKCSVYHGGMTDRDREIAVDLFQKNQNKVIILQIKAGGQSIDLHDLYGRPRVSYICPSDSATATIQALGRTNRTGALSPAIQNLVFAADTIEEQIRLRVDKKIDRIDVLVDGDLALFPNLKEDPDQLEELSDEDFDDIFNA